MNTLRKLLALTIVAATLAAQPEAARAAGEVLSQGAGSAAPASVVQIPASQIPALSMTLPAGALPALPGSGLSVKTIELPQATAPGAAAAAPTRDSGDASEKPAAPEAAPSTPADAKTQAPSASSHGWLVSRLSGPASRRQTGDEAKAGQQAQPGAAQEADGAQDARGDEQRPADAGRAAFDGDLRVFLTAHGREPVEASLSELPALLAKDPAYAQELNRRGLVRLAVAKKAGAVGAAQLPRIEQALRAQGVTAPLSLETVPLQSRPPRAEPAGPAAPGTPKAATLGRRVWSALTAPARELSYLGRSFAASVTTPTREEVVGGVVSKGPAFALSVLWWMNVFLPAKLAAFATTPVGRQALALLHMTAPSAAAAAFPMHFALAVGGSLLLETFHGIWINTWQNFQKILGQQRGVNYQAAFNFLYMQASAAAFRILTWTVIAGTIAPWTLKYWRDMGISSVLGTFFGVLGFFGLNTLYDKGRISRRTRSWLQQGRDLFFLLAGTFLFSGSMHVFWTLWTVQQLLDISLYIISRRAAARPTLYVAEPAVASSDGFKSMYPVTPGPQPSPLSQAVGAVLGNPFVKPLIALGKWAWRKLKGARR